MIPDEVLARARNKEMDRGAFRVLAAAQTANPAYGAIYGLDDVGVIQSAVLIRSDSVDSCLYVDNLFGANLKDAGLLERLSEASDTLEARAVKLIKTETLNVGG